VISNNATFRNQVSISGLSVSQNLTTNQLITDTIRPSGNTLNIGNNNETSIINIGCGNGIQTVNIATNTSTGITTINIGGPSDIVNIAGTLTYISTTSLQVKDNLITLNKGGTTLSGCGIEIESNGSIGGYIKTDNSSGFEFRNNGNTFSISQSSHNPVSLGTTNGLSINNQVLSLGLASGSTNGALSSTDWNTFNNKQNTIGVSNTNNNVLLTNNSGTLSANVNPASTITFTGANLQNLSVSGNTLLDGPVIITKNTTFNQQVALSGLSVSNNVGISGNTTIGQLLSASGLSVSNNVGISGTLTVSTNSLVGQLLSASGLSVSNNVGISGTLTVSSNSLVGQLLSASGLSVSNNVGISGTLTVSSNSLVGQLLSASGLSVSNNVGISGTLTVSSNSLVRQLLSASGLSVSHSATFNNGITVLGNATFNSLNTSTLYVNGVQINTNTTTVFTSEITVSALNVSNNANFNNGINTLGNATFNQLLSVSGLYVSNNAFINTIDASFIFINGQPIGSGSIADNLYITYNGTFGQQLSTSGLYVSNNANIHSIDASFIFINGQPIGSGSIPDNLYITYNGTFGQQLSTSGLYVINDLVIGNPGILATSTSYGYTFNNNDGQLSLIIQTLIVPQGITQLYVELYGSKATSGGLGGKASGYLSVIGGDTLNLFVGGNDGLNGGAGFLPSLSLGGDGTDIRIGGTGLEHRVIVAGGGGSNGTLGAGGAGGGLNGGNGIGNEDTGGGNGGTQDNGGSGGIGFINGLNGEFGLGGLGGNIDYGNGGGGYFGGGGGASEDNNNPIPSDSGGGGGGSSWGHPQLITGFTTESGVNDGTGYIVISYSGEPIKGTLTVYNNATFDQQLSTSGLYVSKNISVFDYSNLPTLIPIQAGESGLYNEIYIPIDVKEISVTLYGSIGEGYSIGGILGGNGGIASGILNVSGGQTFYAYLGGLGFNGGGAGGIIDSRGGGATDIRIGGTGLANRIIVAGGGGGVGIYEKNNTISATTGGLGGGLIGSNGLGDAFAGKGGTQNEGGAGGNSFNQGAAGTSGSLGQGGNGGISGNNNGGGGGGGYYGGGGGAFFNGDPLNPLAGGGGGGSSWGHPDLVSNFTTQPGGNNTYGMIVISYRLINSNSGKISIGKKPTIYQLELSQDSAFKPGGNVWTTSSDQRVKKDIQIANYETCYNNVKSIDLKHFTWDPFKYPNVADRNVIGFIAQDVAKVYPKAVSIGPYSFPDGTTIEDFHSLNADQLYKNLWGAFRYLQDKNESLEQKIITLEEIVKQLINNTNTNTN
jgi:hypothetical protein